MIQSFRPSRAAHAGVSIGVLILALILAASLIAGLVTHFSVQLSSLKARTHSAAALAVRLEESRAEIGDRLEAIGVAPRDFEAVASPDTAKELVNNACAILAQSIEAACAMEEVPLTATIALHQARVTASGPAAQIVSALTTAAAAPVRIANLTMKPGGQESLVELSALIEIAGARSGGPAS